MARLFTSGFETGALAAEGISTSGTAPTIETSGTHIRSGARALTLTASGASVASIPFTAVSARDYFGRIYLKFSSLPGQAVIIAAFVDAGGNLEYGVRLNTDGTLNLMMVTGSTVIGSASAALAVDTWYRIELKSNVNSSLFAADAAELRLNGTTVATDTGTDRASNLPATFQLGALSGLTGSWTAKFDDVALNDDQGASQNSYPGSGKVVHLHPTVDNGSAGFTGGAGGLSNYWDAMNNVPPAGVVLGSATDTSQVKGTNSNTTDYVEETLAAYTTAVASGGGGMVSGDSVSLVQGVARIGNSTTTSRNFGCDPRSNPDIAETVAGSGTTAAGTEPTGWTTIRSAYAYAPSVTLGTAPTMRVRKATASTNAAMCDYMAYLVEYVPSNAQQVAIGQVTETDIAQAMTRAKAKAIGRSTETDIAQAMTRGKLKPIGQASETDTAQHFTVAKLKTIGQVLETDIAQAMTRGKLKPIGQVVEVDTAQVFTYFLSHTIGQVVEVDIVQALARQKAKAIGRVEETDVALALAHYVARAIGQVEEVDTAQALAILKTLPIGQVQETDAAQPVIAIDPMIVPIGRVQETDTAQPVAWSRAVGIGRVDEAESAQALTVLQAHAIGRATETDTAQQLLVVKTKLIGQVEEADSGRQLGHVRAMPIGRVQEVDTAQALNRLKAMAIGRVEEIDTAAVVAALKQLAIGRVEELDSAQALILIGGLVGSVTARGNDLALIVAHVLTRAKVRAAGGDDELIEHHVETTGV